MDPGDADRMGACLPCVLSRSLDIGRADAARRCPCDRLACTGLSGLPALMVRSRHEHHGDPAIVAPGRGVRVLGAMGCAALTAQLHAIKKRPRGGAC